jgi:hypothetical protein
MPLPLGLLIGGSAVLGAGASIYGANRAANAQTDASRDALELQRQQYNTNLQLLEPQRMLGYGALADIAQMYGYALPGYQGVNQVLGGAGGPGSNVQGIGSASGNNWYDKKILGIPINPLNALGLGGRRDPQVSVRDGMVYFDGRKDGGTLYGGHINPITGEVWVDTPDGARDPRLSELATQALRSGQMPQGGEWGRFNLAYNQLARSGWTYNPQQTPQGMAANGLGPRPAGQPGDMSRFFASPDYQFRRDEGQRGIGNSFAARGGAASGNALRALSEFNQNLASGEYGNYMNRLFNMAGMNQTATTQAIGSGQNFANQGAAATQAMGDARASGIVSGINGAVNSLNTGMSNLLLNRYFSGAQAPPAMTTNYGPWASGYRFGG